MGATAVLGGLVTRRGRRGWYDQLRKPPFNPPPAAFGPAWTALYAGMIWSGYRVWRAPASPARTSTQRRWAGQLALNAAWSPLFFGLHRPGWALADIAALLPAIGLYIAAARRVDRPAAWMMAPYLGWVAFATVLNLEIVRRNG